ncbi:MAG TPA: hypothetical protein VLS89_06435, partial [Candidatus Nanopelagicales bacterium]|nr:hypothetical protein [Candidatus Nanopelagicales bacterium]
MGHPLRRTGVALAACAALTGAAAPAGAQQLARDRFALGVSDPAPAGDRFYRVESAELLGHGAFDAALVADFGFSPFVVERPDGRGGREERPVVANQLLVHAGLAATLWDRLKLSANLPMGST